ncbi:hypothetical protein G6F57_018271 [Rhizopus arrhizus]|nr:hypothetical protein G6F57_018271 [Rhizopus arrhizus]
MLGGSADLTGSNFTDWKGVAAVRAGDKGIQFGRHINYGVREFGMAAIMNGVALHGGYLPSASCTCSPTIRSAWAKTARPTNPSSTPPACA